VTVAPARHDKEMKLLEHLQELRRRLTVVLRDYADQLDQFFVLIDAGVRVRGTESDGQRGR
jgi:hypothetical protein